MGLFYISLTPTIDIDAMLNSDPYTLMNWGMAVDGIIFWWLMIAPRRAQGDTVIIYLAHILILSSEMILQILPGAYIAVHRSPIDRRVRYLWTHLDD